jgi:hypothetical protein
LIAFRCANGKANRAGGANRGSSSAPVFAVEWGCVPATSARIPAKSAEIRAFSPHSDDFFVLAAIFSPEMVEKREL